MEIAAKNNTLVNEQIKGKELRVISDTGEQLGIMSSAQALALAEEQDLDLVLIAPNAKPPVCKIMNYGKYCFEQAKKAKENKKKQKTLEIKEIRLSLNIDVHDFNTKLKQAERFLKAGNKVKCSIRLRGREMGHSDMGVQTMNAQINLPDNLMTTEHYAYLLQEIHEIHRKVDRLLQTPQFIGEWLNGTEFCKKYNISRPTLYRKVQNGLIEVQTLDNIKRYRIKEGA